MQSDGPSSPPNIADLVADPNWLPHHLRGDDNSIEFVHLPRAAHGQVTFLSDEYFDGATPRVVVAQREVGPPALALPPQPLHFIFHSAFCGSTLLTRLVDIEGVAMGLKEPAGLNDLAHILRRPGKRPDVRPALAALLALYARPFATGETTIVKPSNVANAVIDDVLAIRPDARALLLYSPLPAFLRSLASKGLFARIWARKLGFALDQRAEIDFGFSSPDKWLQTDLQVAALGWLQQQAQFARLVRAHGSERIRTGDSVRLLADLPSTMRALADLFQRDRTAFERAAQSPIRFADSKRHNRPFDVEVQESEQAAAQHAYGEEIDKVVVWAEAVARQFAIPMTLGAPLLD